MGPTQSSTIKACMDIVNKNMLSIVNSKQVNAGAYQYNKNSIDVKISGSIDCPEVVLSQTINGTQNIKVFSKFESTNDLAQTVKQALDQSFKSDQKAINDFLSVGFQSQKNDTELLTSIKNVIDTNIKNEDITSCNAIQDNLNLQKLDITGNIKCDLLKIPQDLVATQQAECISQTAFGILMRSELISDAVTKVDNTQFAENKGITDFLKNLIGPLIIIGIIIVLVIIAKNVFTKSPQPYMGGGYGAGYSSMSSGRSAGSSVNFRT